MLFLVNHSYFLDLMSYNFEPHTLGLRFRELVLQRINTPLLPGQIGRSRLTSSLELIAKLVRDQTDRTYATLSRTVAIYVSAGFAAGLALGITCGVLIQRYWNDHTKAFEYQIALIQAQLDALKYENRQLGEARPVIPVVFEAYFDEEGDDEFFETRSRQSSDKSLEFMSPAASSGSIYGSLNSNRSERCAGSINYTNHLPSASLPAKIIFDLDALAEAATSGRSNDENDLSGDYGLGSRAFSRCLVYKKQYKRYPEFLWRFARAAYLVSLEADVYSSTSAGDGPKTGEEFRDLGLLLARRAIHLVKIGLAQPNPLPTPDEAAQAYKWLAIFVGLAAQSGSSVNQKIEMGYEFKKYVDLSLDLNPEDAYVHFLKGRWCFEVYNLSWIERQFASRLFAEPPAATIEEAMAEFMEVERLKPDYWPSNKIYLSKCEYALSNYEAAIQLVNQAGTLLSSNQPIGDETDRKILLDEVEVLKTKYQSWF